MTTPLDVFRNPEQFGITYPGGPEPFFLPPASILIAHQTAQQSINGLPDVHGNVAYFNQLQIGGMLIPIHFAFQTLAADINLTQNAWTVIFTPGETAFPPGTYYFSADVTFQSGSVLGNKYAIAIEDVSTGNRFAGSELTQLTASAQVYNLSASTIITLEEPTETQAELMNVVMWTNATGAIVMHADAGVDPNLLLCRFAMTQVAS